MRELHVIVSNKVATYLRRDGDIICGNNDYTIVFNFDSEWSAYEKKTARFIWNGKYQDIEFTNNRVKVPTLSNTRLLEVGVYAGDISTTTSAEINCVLSVLCGNNQEYGRVLKLKSATVNGIYRASDEGADGYSEFEVNVPSPTSEEVVITPTKDKQVITAAKAGYISRAIVNPIPDEYIIPNLIEKTIEADGVYDAREEGADGYSVITVCVPPSDQPTLNAPSISLSGSILTISDTANATFANSYDIYSNGELLANVTSASVDLSTLFDEVGEYSITVKAKGTHFNDSENSNVVTYGISFMTMRNNDCEVAITVQNSSDTLYWSATEIFADECESNKIGSISSADGSTTVTTGTGYVRVQFSSAGIPWAGAITTSGGVEEIYHNDYYAVFAVSDNGTITIDGWDFSY